MRCVRRVAPGNCSRPRSARRRSSTTPRPRSTRPRQRVVGADAQIASAQGQYRRARGAVCGSAEHAGARWSSAATRRRATSPSRCCARPMTASSATCSVEQGDLISPGQKLAVIVPMDKLYIVANFKETQLARLVPGEKVRVSVDACPTARVRGNRVVAGAGLGCGVFAAAAGERHRQLHQGRAARAGAHRRARRTC